MRMIAAALGIGLAGVIISALVTPSVTPSDIDVVDGDTIGWRGERYRFRNWDAPETRPGQFKCIGERRKGERATQALRHMIDSAARLRIVDASPGRDFFGRRLATLRVDGEDAGKVLAGQGLAKPSPDGRQQDWCTFVHPRD